MPKVHYRVAAQRHRVAAQRRLRHAAGDAFLSALLTRSSRRRLNGLSGVSQYRVEGGPPPLLQRKEAVLKSRPTALIFLLMNAQIAVHGAGRPRVSSGGGQGPARFSSYRKPRGGWGASASTVRVGCNASGLGRCDGRHRFTLRVPIIFWMPL